jgi:amino acid permease
MKQYTMLHGHRINNKMNALDLVSDSIEKVVFPRLTKTAFDRFPLFFFCFLYYYYVCSFLVEYDKEQTECS